jgi:cell division septation protein DedD
MGEDKKKPPGKKTESQSEEETTSKNNKEASITEGFINELDGYLDSVFTERQTDLLSKKPPSTLSEQKIKKPEAPEADIQPRKPSLTKKTTGEKRVVNGSGKYIPKANPWRLFILAGILLAGVVAYIIYPLFIPTRDYRPSQSSPPPIAVTVVKKPLSHASTKLAFLPAQKPVMTSPTAIGIENSAPLPLQQAFQAEQTELAYLPPKTSLPAPGKIDDSDDIRAFLIRWKTAWEMAIGKNEYIEKVISFYSMDFTSGGLDRVAWVKALTEKYNQKTLLGIELESIQTLKPSENNRHTITFVKNDESPEGFTVLKRTLVLSKASGDWKIVANHFPGQSYPYTIHGGSFQSKEAAEKMADTYGKSGLKVFWVKVALGAKGIWYRIFIGCYETPAAAQKIIAQKKLKDALVKKTPYAVHMGTFLSEPDLSNRIQSLSDLGYSPYVIQDEMDRQHLYLGSFINRKSALSLEMELKAQGILSETVAR